MAESHPRDREWAPDNMSAVTTLSRTSRELDRVEGTKSSLSTMTTSVHSIDGGNICRDGVYIKSLRIHSVARFEVATNQAVACRGVTGRLRAEVGGTKSHTGQILVTQGASLALQPAVFFPYSVPMGLALA